MRKIFLILMFTVFQIRTNAENGDSTTVHVADVYYEILGANAGLSFNTELFYRGHNEQKIFPTIRFSAFSMFYPWHYYNYSISARINTNINGKIFPFVEGGIGNYYEIDLYNKFSVLKDPGFFVGLGSKFYLWKKLLLSPEFYIIHHEGIVTFENDWKPFFGLSIGTLVNYKKEHYKDDFYKERTSFKNYISLDLVYFLGTNLTYQRVMFSSKLISFFTSLGANISFISYIEPMKIPFAGIGIKLSPYKLFYITYSLNKDLVSGTWITSNIGFHIARNIGISYKNILPIDGFSKNSSYEYYYGIDRFLPMLNLDIFF